MTPTSTSQGTIRSDAGRRQRTWGSARRALDADLSVRRGTPPDELENLHWVHERASRRNGVDFPAMRAECEHPPGQLKHRRAPAAPSTARSRNQVSQPRPVALRSLTDGSF